MYTKEELSGLKMRELVSIYNSLNGSNPVKRFGSLKDGAERILKFQDYSEKKFIKEQSSKGGRVSVLIKKYKNLTNAEFTEVKEFINLCEKAETDPTVRQASKFRNMRGLAYLSA